MDHPVSKTRNHPSHNEDSHQEMRIILLGKTGLGKSSLGNSICGSKEKNSPFEANSSSSSVTQTSQYAYRIYNGRKLCVIDTPGLSGTQQSNEIIIQELKHAFQLASPGPHAFLIVINGRCTEEQIGALLLLQKVFGSPIVKHCIIVITRENDLRGDDDDDNQLSDAELLDQYFNEAPESLIKLMIDIRKRCILIENRALFEIREQKVDLLIEMIETIEQQNGYYTDRMFVKAEQQWQQWEKEEIERQRVDREQQKENLRKQIQQENLPREEALQHEEQMCEVLRREEECLRREIRDIRRQKMQQRICGTIVTILNTISDQIPIPTNIFYNFCDGWVFRF